MIQEFWFRIVMFFSLTFVNEILQSWILARSLCLLGAWTLWQWHHIWRPYWCSHGEFYIFFFLIHSCFDAYVHMKWKYTLFKHPGFVRRVQSSEVEEQEPADLRLHLHFPSIELPWDFFGYYVMLSLQNVVHTFAKLRVNIGDFKVT